MDAAKTWIAVWFAISLCGCAANTQGGVAYVKASDVIDELKDELAVVDKSSVDEQILVPKTSCGKSLDSEHNAVHVSAEFDSADVVLKTIATNSVAGTASVAKLPLGVVLVGTSAILTHTDIRTQQVTYSLSADPSLLFDEGADAAESKSNQPFTPGASGYIQIYRVGEKTPPIDSVSPDNDTDANSHPHLIADAILAARDQILAIDHARKPCLLPTKVKVQIDFQVQQKTDVKGDIGFLTFLDVGSEIIRQKEAAHSMIVTFTLKGSSVALQQSDSDQTM
jgi:hypothetical protein